MAFKKLRIFGRVLTIKFHDLTKWRQIVCNFRCCDWDFNKCECIWCYFWFKKHIWFFKIFVFCFWSSDLEHFYKICELINFDAHRSWFLSILDSFKRIKCSNWSSISIFKSSIFLQLKWWKRRIHLSKWKVVKILIIKIRVFCSGHDLCSCSYLWCLRSFRWFSIV